MESPTPDDATPEMKSQLRAAVARAVGALRTATHPTLAALLCSSACAPVIAAALGTGAVPAALLGTLGAIGGGALTNLVTGMVDRLRHEQKEDFDEAAISWALAERIDELAAADSEEGAALRKDVAAVLEATDAARIAVETAIQAGDEQLLTRITAEFEQQAASFGEYSVLLAEVRATTRQVLEDLRSMHTRQHHQGQHTIALLTRILNRLPAQREPDTSTAEKVTEPPYRGLMPYRGDQTALFFGRERATAALLGKAAACADTGGPLIVTGASGAGKSSLLRAGFLPAIAAGGLQVQGAETWPFVYVTPGDAPFDALGIELARLDRSDGNAVSRALSDDPRRACVQVRQRLPVPTGDEHARLVLVIDQFEEVFTIADEEEREAFITAVLSIAEGNGARSALVVLGLRSDFVDRCADHPELVTALQDNAFVVGPMTAAEIRRTITGPAEAVGVPIDEDLASAILDDLRSVSGGPGFGPGALPLVSQMMLMIWRKEQGVRLTSSAYASFGGVSNAVAVAAEEVYGGLDETRRGIARQLFSRMVVVAKDGGLSKRAVRQGSLNDLGPECDAVREAFTDARLLVAEGQTVEIAHEALLEYWTRLRDWTGEDRESQAMRSQLIEDAEEWDRNDREASFLYRGKRFAAVERERWDRWRMKSEQFPPPGPTALEFLDAARALERRRGRARQVAVAGIAGLLSLVVIAVGMAFIANQRSIEQQQLQISTQLAQASRELAVTDGPLAQLLAAAAWEVGETDEAWAAMANAVHMPATGVVPNGYDVGSYSMALSGDGRTLAHLDGSGYLAFRDVESMNTRRIKGEFSGFATAMVLNEDASVVVAGNTLNTTVLDAGSGDVLTVLDGTAESEAQLALSPDRTRFAALHGTNAVRVWDFATFETLGTIELGSRPTAVAFGASENELIIGDESGRVGLWDTATMSESHSHTLRAGIDSVEPMPGGAGRYAVCAMECSVLSFEDGTFQSITGTLFSAAWSPDGRYLVALHSDGSLGVWTADSLDFVGMIPTGDLTYDIDFDPDSRTLYGLSENTLVAWDLGRLRAARTYDTGNWTDDLEFTPDGSRLISTGEGPTNLWDATGTDLELLEELPDIGGNDTAISPDGRTAATADSDSGLADIVIWDLDSGAVEQTLKGHTGHVTGLDFSSDGSTLVSSSSRSTRGSEGPDEPDEMFELRVWDLETGKTRTTIAVGKEHAPFAMDLRPDDRAVAVLDDVGGLSEWDVETGQLRHSMQVDQRDAATVAYTSDGSQIGVGSVNGLLLWSPTTDQTELLDLGGDAGSVVKFAFGPDNRYLALSVSSRSDDRNQVVIRDLIRGEIVHTIPIWTVPVEVVFAPDGQTLAVAISEELIQLYDIRFLSDPRAAVCEQAGREFTEQEWGTYLPGIPLGSIDVCG
jgi:WD40 repeat protein